MYVAAWSWLAASTQRRVFLSFKLLGNTTLRFFFRQCVLPAMIECRYSLKPTNLLFINNIWALVAIDPALIAHSMDVRAGQSRIWICKP